MQHLCQSPVNTDGYGNHALKVLSQPERAPPALLRAVRRLLIAAADCRLHWRGLCMPMRQQAACVDAVNRDK
jgi:hypothetical protein